MGELKVTEIDGRLLLLDNLRTALSIDHKFMGLTQDKSLWERMFMRNDEPSPSSVCLHRGNVVLFPDFGDDYSELENDLTLWLCQFNWQLDRPVGLQESTTDNPLEDGFFTSAGVWTGDVSKEPRLTGQTYHSNSTSIVALADFIRREMAKPWTQDCEEYLRSCYASVPNEQLTHPVFKSLDFPTFGEGFVLPTFAGSVWSPTDLRFWSRPTFYPR